MWFCIHCGTENNDAESVCAKCGTQKSAGRFGGTPRVVTAKPQGTPVYRRNAQSENAPMRERQTLREELPPVRRTYAAPPAPQKSSRFAGFLIKYGITLCVLVTLLWVLVCVNNYSMLEGVFCSLIFEQGRELPALLRILVFAGFALAGEMLLLLPGLTMIAQGKKIRISE